MSPATIESKEPRTQPKLACRLRKKMQGRTASSPTAGEFELENLSTEPFEIEFDMSVLQYANLVVTASSGATVSTGHYGDIFSPMANAQKLRLNSGATFVGPISLFATVPAEKRLPGRYSVQAIFEYHGTRIISDPLIIDLPQ
ncbi:MAG: hypothetical protein HY289_14800 [Planctomycetes bacterium]|nr:hypothetical protein [Planctomycetota bacterium]